MISFKQSVKDTDFYFGVNEEWELVVHKYYNAKGLKYVYEMEKDVSVSELARLVEMFKRMPDEMWEKVEPEECENFVPQNVSKGIRRRN